MITGAIIALTGIVAEQIWTYFYGKSFPVSFKIWTAIAIASSIAAYVIISLLSREEFDMDKMLHRGKYTIEQDHEKGSWLHVSAIRYLGRQYLAYPKRSVAIAANAEQPPENHPEKGRA